MCCFILCKCIHTKWSCIVLHISWIEQRYGSFTRTHTQNHTKSAFYFSRDVRLTTRLACCEWLCVHQDKATALQCIIIIFNVVTHGNQTNFQSVCIHFDRIICATRKKIPNGRKYRSEFSMPMTCCKVSTFERKPIFLFSSGSLLLTHTNVGYLFNAHFSCATLIFSTISRLSTENS